MDKALELSKAFKSPDSKYRSALFWAWNTSLDKKELCRQIEAFKKMGFGGFYMHSRIGLDTEYLGEDYFDSVSACIEKAESVGMYAELYDEDLWPSGLCGGLVTDENPTFRRTSLLFTPHEYEKENYKFIGKYKIYLDGKDCLSESGRELIYYAYSVTAPDSLPYQSSPLADPLNEDGVKLFIELTHEKYKKVAGEHFGKTVRTIFTDEPTFETLFPKKHYLTDTCGTSEVSTPWSDRFEEMFFSEYGYSISERLPELFFEPPVGVFPQVRYDYRSFISRLFRKNYFDRITAWCNDSGLSSTGHILYEETLASQSCSSGEAMEQYSAMHIPGMDLLFDEVQYNTAKQVQSVIHQMGKEGMMSELYGVTGWNFDFRDYKFQGDWQAALGVTLRVPHLGWLSMRGPAKRDYPSSIGVQSPWHSEFSFLEDHYARLNTVLQRGKPIVNIGVIHPIESFWISMGPDTQTAATREKLDSDFASLAALLLENNLDFDYISESLLCEWQKEKESANVGQCRYRVIIVPRLICLRESTVLFLERFIASGGEVIFLGKCPKCIMGGEERLKNTFETSRKCTYSELVNSLEKFREIKISCESGRKMIYSLREDENRKLLFAAFSQKNQSSSPRDSITIRINGKYTPKLYDSITGDIKNIPYRINENDTEIILTAGCHDSILLVLDEFDGFPFERHQDDRKGKVVDCNLLSIAPDEDNVLLLDAFEYSFDGEIYYPKKNVLLIDREFRERNKLPIRSNYNRAQPWKKKTYESCGKLYLRAEFESDITYEGAFLALENPKLTEIKFNGTYLDKETVGYYIDTAIERIKLTDIKKGKNILELCISMFDSNILGAESCYILGDFGVSVIGDRAKITSKCEKLGYIPLTEVSMPFFGGNILYESEFYTEESEIMLTLPSYKGAVVRVFLDGCDKGVICLAPYTLTLGRVQKGKHILTLKLYGNRHNCLSPLHYKGDKKGELPAMWEPMGINENKEYRLCNIGILSPPIIEAYSPT